MRTCAIAIAAAAALAAGCTTIVHETHAFDGPSGTPGKRIVNTVTVANNGWNFFFDLLPIVCSDPKGGIRFFHDGANIQANLDVLDDVMRREGATGIENLTTHETNESVLLVLFNRHVIFTSASLLADDGEKGAAGQ